MKKFILYSLLAFLTHIADAATLQVDNNSVHPYVYTNLQTAINAATAGDTIMVKGSPNNYGDITVAKPLSLIGEGFSPNIENPKLDGITIRSSNVHFSGFYISTGAVAIRIEVNNASGGVISNLEIERCYFTQIRIQGCSGCQLQNVYFRNNVIKYFVHEGGGLQIDTLVFENNIFDLAMFSDWFYATGMSTVILRNNLFMNIDTQNGNTTFYVGYWGSGLHDAILYNNIFYATKPTQCNGCTFYNNLTYLSLGNDTLPGGSNNNIIGNPLLVNYTGGNFNFNHDYTLQTTSPCNGTGAGVTDIGITGGLHPFTPGAGPRIPAVDFINISNTAVQENTQFFLQFDARTRK